MTPPRGTPGRGRDSQLGPGQEASTPTPTQARILPLTQPVLVASEPLHPRPLRVGAQSFPGDLQRPGGRRALFLALSVHRSPRRGLWLSRPSPLSSTVSGHTGAAPPGLALSAAGQRRPGTGPGAREGPL